VFKSREIIPIWILALNFSLEEHFLIISFALYSSALTSCSFRIVVADNTRMNQPANPFHFHLPLSPYKEEGLGHRIYILITSVV
jgi:hypothetical protein